MGGEECEDEDKEMTLRDLITGDNVDACIVYCRIGEKNFFVHFGYSFEEMVGIGHIIETRMTDLFNLPSEEEDDNDTKKIEKVEVAGYA